jgi:hypothetical protein
VSEKSCEDCEHWKFLFQEKSKKTRLAICRVNAPIWAKSADSLICYAQEKLADECECFESKESKS